MKGTPQKETLDNIAYTCMLSILLTSFTSVSILSVCCYSSVSISIVFLYADTYSTSSAHVPYMTADREAFKATFCCCGKAEAERGRLPTWATQTSTTTLISTNSEVALPSKCFFIMDTA
jgi:hypothetical protein